MATTVEAIQAYLEGIGWILFPIESEDSEAPKVINYEEYVRLDNPRVFEQPNLAGPTYHYYNDPVRKIWRLSE